MAHELTRRLKNTLALLMRFSLESSKAETQRELARLVCRFLQECLPHQACAVAFRRRDRFLAAYVIEDGGAVPGYIGTPVVREYARAYLSPPTCDLASIRWVLESPHPLMRSTSAVDLVIAPLYLGVTVVGLVLCWATAGATSSPDLSGVSQGIPALVCPHISAALSRLMMRDKGQCEMATRVAHLAATPISLARREIDHALTAGSVNRRKQFLSNARRHLSEAEQAFERAYMFDSSPETCLIGPINVNSLFRGAADDAAFPRLKIVLADGSVVYGNQFRLWYAVRDLFACAHLLDPKTSIRTELKPNELVLFLDVGVPLPKGVDPNRLFSAQYHVEMACMRQQREGQPFLPASLSLLLARQLIEERPPSGQLTVVKAKDGVGFSFRLQLPLHKESP